MPVSKTESQLQTQMSVRCQSSRVASEPNASTLRAPSTAHVPTLWWATRGSSVPVSPFTLTVGHTSLSGITGSLVSLILCHLVFVPSLYPISFHEGLFIQVSVYLLFFYLFSVYSHLHTRMINLFLC